jgi:transposase InsO family protein
VFKKPMLLQSTESAQFRARAFVAVLRRAGLAGSMGRVASASDNAAMESLHSLLQKNVLDRHCWSTRDDLTYTVFYWIEHTYNHRRRHSSIGYLKPNEFEEVFEKQLPNA